MPRITPGGPLPPGAFIRVTQGAFEGYVGTVTSTREEDGRLTHYGVLIKRAEEEEGGEFQTWVEAAAVEQRCCPPT